jgi:hypothetical protein
LILNLVLIRIGILGLSLPKIGSFCAALAAVCLALNWKLLDMQEQLRAADPNPVRRVILGNNAGNLNNVPGAVELSVTRIGTFGDNWEQLQDVESGFVFFHNRATGAIRPADQIPPEIDQNVVPAAAAEVV